MKPKSEPEDNNPLIISSHFMMVILYTILTAALIAEGFVMDWEKWPDIPMAAGVVGVWYLHIFRVASNRLRVYLCSALMMVEFFYYGTHETSVFDLAMVICMVICLFAMTGLHSLVNLCQITYYLTMVYGLVKMAQNGTVFDGLLISRSMLHFGVVTMMAWIARRIIDRWSEVIEMSREEIAIINDSAKRLSDLIANVSHEIRTPINAILGLCTMHISEEKDKKKLSDLQAMRDAGARIGRQIDDILDYSEIDRKALVNNCEDYMLSSVLNDLVGEFDSMRDRDIELVIDVEATIPSVMNTDVSKLKRILYHLIQNGLKYTQEGGVYVHISSIPQEYGINLYIEVKDTGIGMDKEQLERICDSFYKADSGRNRTTGGLGLGMMIVHGFVRSLGGFMTIDSTPGEGTSVRVSIPNRVIDPGECMSVSDKEGVSLGAYLHFEKYNNPHVREYYNSMLKNIVTGLDVPLHRVDNADSLRALVDSKKLTHIFAGAEEYENAKDLLQQLSKTVMVTVVANPGEVDLPAGSMVKILPKPFYCFPIIGILNSRSGSEMGDDGQVSFPGARVLVVDDEPMNLVVTQSMLSRYGCVVTTCGSGQEAVGLCRDREFDVILMDHMMPVMDGVEAMKLIRSGQTKGRINTPIIAFTANSVSSAREMFRNAGFDDFLGKPLERLELEHVLKRALPASLVVTGCKNAEAPEYNKNEPEPEVSRGREDKDMGIYEKLEKAGVDTDQGKHFCNDDEEFYMMILSQYVEESHDKKRIIKESLETGDLKTYAIQVHSIKSTSKMIGAMKLSEAARLLEEAADNNDRDYIDKNHADMLEGYENVIAAIGDDGSMDAKGGPAGTHVEEADGYEILEFTPSGTPGEGEKI